MSATSVGPSSPNRPPDVPCPRASHMSDAYPAGARNAVASGSMSWCLPPSPWKSITAGQPPAGAVPSGSTSAHESAVPSAAVMVSSCGEAARAEPAQTSAAKTARTRTIRRPTAAQG